MKDFENLSEEEKKRAYEEWIKKKAVDAIKPQEKEKPVRQVFIPLGEDYNSKFVLWKTSLQITKSHKEGGEWKDTQTINLSKRLLIELMARIPSFVGEMEAREE
jgi:hypothetical protein